MNNAVFFVPLTIDAAWIAGFAFIAMRGRRAVHKATRATQTRRQGIDKGSRQKAVKHENTPRARKWGSPS